jgi:hypothetical protein
MLLRGRTISYGLFAALIVLVIQVSCSRKAEVTASSNPATLENLKHAQESLKPSPTPLSTPNSPIRKVDFRNFTYPEPRYGYLYERIYTEKGIGYYQNHTNTAHKLIDGEEPLIKDKEGLWRNDPAGLVSLDYADVTGDGKEEALIELGISVRGSAIPTYLYVYAWEKTKLRLLFTFAAGDRADGGFRRMYAANGELIIELNAGDENAPFCDGCRATRFSRFRYKWSGRRFVLVNSEILPISS